MYICHHFWLKLLILAKSWNTYTLQWCSWFNVDVSTYGGGSKLVLVPSSMEQPKACFRLGVKAKKS
jgi:hypothetical protein